MKPIQILLAVLLSGFISSTVKAQQGGILKRSDMITIELKTPAEDAKDISGQYVVSDSGTVKMPMLNAEIPATGITPTALARRIEAAYRSEQIYKNPTINAYLPQEAGIANHVVLVSGEVRSPGEWPLRDGMNLNAAIAKSGGFTEFAKTKAVKLIRGNRATIYDMRKIAEDGSNNPVLKDGDQIIVPSG